MDARDRLRAYLEQRRELGESEFVLDGMSVTDALRALGVKGTLPETPTPREARTTGPVSSDWREALRSVGVSEPGAPPASPPATPPARPSARPPAKPPAEVAPTAPASSGELVQGIVVGHEIELGGGPLTSLESIDAVAKAITACTACPLHASAKNAVPGEGNPHAGFVCVGEAPGATEDETGRPFVGQAGQLLTKILAAIEFTREDVFICNVLKHRPPGNRNPAPDEIKACSPFLMRQLELLKPRVILALGTFAAQTLLQTTQPIGKLRGQVHRYYGVPLIVTYHPAALLRNPSWKRPTWEDVQLARRIFDNAADRGA
jgi:uracil-DNA glycosylase family 4